MYTLHLEEKLFGSGNVSCEWTVHARPTGRQTCEKGRRGPSRTLMVVRSSRSSRRTGTDTTAGDDPTGASLGSRTGTGYPRRQTTRLPLPTTVTKRRKDASQVIRLGPSRTSPSTTSFGLTGQPTSVSRVPGRPREEPQPTSTNCHSWQSLSQTLFLGFPSFLFSSLLGNSPRPFVSRVKFVNGYYTTERVLTEKGGA